MAVAAENAAAGCMSGIFRVCGCVSNVVIGCCGLFGGWIKRLPAPVVGGILRFTNITNAFLLGTAAYFGYQIALGDVTKSFLTTYIFLFGILLLLVRGTRKS